MIVHEPQAVTSSQLRELDVAWRNASTRVPLATSRVTVLKPYTHIDLAGQYNWADRGFNSIDIGVPRLGIENETISSERPPVFKPINHAYYYARLAFPSSGTRKLTDRLRGGQGAALAARQWSLWHVGTNNLEAFLVHERAHGQWLEAEVFIGGFKEKVFAAVADTLGVPTIDRKSLLGASLLGARSRREAHEIARAERMQLEIRIAVADEFGLYAATLPQPTSRRHPWNELWPSFVTTMECLPGHDGPVSSALQPLREEIAAISPDRQRLYLYGRLDARSMRSEELEFLMREQFDLYVVAMARSGRVNANAASEFMGQARDRGVELDVAFLKTATAMGDFMPSLHGRSTPREGLGGPREQRALARPEFPAGRAATPPAATARPVDAAMAAHPERDPAQPGCDTADPGQLSAAQAGPLSSLAGLEFPAAAAVPQASPDRRPRRAPPAAPGPIRKAST